MTITSFDQVLWDRLVWPEAKPRSGRRERGPFTTEIDKATTEINYEMAKRDDVSRFHISRNKIRALAGDPAAALWWETHEHELRVLACDKYDTQAKNLHAIALTLQALRALERWGAYTTEQAEQGARLALPAPEGASDIMWQAVLGDLPEGLDGDDALAVVNGRYRRLAAEANADEKELRRLNLAVEAARKELGA
jgi:hypothetical protein